MKQSYLHVVFTTGLLLFSNVVFSSGEFERFMEGNSPPTESEKKLAEQLFVGTWALIESSISDKSTLKKTDFMHVLDSRYLFTSITKLTGEQDDWFDTNENVSFGDWNLNIEKVLPVSKDIENQAKTYIKKIEAIKDRRETLVIEHLPELKNMSFEEKKRYAAENANKIKDILKNEPPIQPGRLSRAQKVLAMVSDAISDNQKKIFFGGIDGSLAIADVSGRESYSSKKHYDKLTTKNQAILYFTGSRIYISRYDRGGMIRLNFMRPPVANDTLSTEMISYYNEKLDADVKARANTIYSSWNRLCGYWKVIEENLPKNAVTDCKKERDSLLALGIKKQKDYVYPYVHTKMPNEFPTEEIEGLIALKNQPFSIDTKKQPIPYLGYCFSNVDLAADERMFSTLLNSGFKGTAFTISLQSTFESKPESWTQAQFDAYRSIRFSSQLVLLREDGIMGIYKEDANQRYKTKKNGGMYYDSANTWRYADKKIELSFLNGKVRRTLYTAKFHLSPAVASTGGQMGTFLHWQIHFVYGDHQIYFGESDIYKELKKKVPRNSVNQCDYLQYGSALNKQETIPEPTLTTKSTLTKNKADKASELSKPKPFSLPDYAHIKVVPLDPNAAIAPQIKAMWAKGFYIHLKPDGNFGFNTDNPGPYVYLPVNRWENKNGVLTLTLDKVIYRLSLPKESTNKSTTLTTVESTWNAFKMTYVTKIKDEL